MIGDRRLAGLSWAPRRQAAAACLGAVAGTVLALAVGRPASQPPVPAAAAAVSALTPSSRPAASATTASTPSPAVPTPPADTAAPSPAAPVATATAAAPSPPADPSLRTDPAALWGPNDVWVGYGLVRERSDAETARDFDVMHAAGVTGVVTYTALFAQPVDLARERGMKMILGIYDPRDPTEVTAAIALAQAAQSPVVAIAVGDRGLAQGRYTTAELMSTMATVRAATHLPVSTSEDAMSGTEDAVVDLGDFVFPDVEPVYSAPSATCGAVAYGSAMAAAAVTAIAHVRGIAGGRPLYIHETGLPVRSGRACPGSADAQLAYFCALHTPAGAGFVHFDAVDDPANQPGDFGLWDAADTPRPIVTRLASC